MASINGNKAPRKELDALTKGKIAGQAAVGATPTQISQILNVPRTTIQSVLKRLKTTPLEVNKPRSGRPSIVTPRATRSLLRQVKSNPKIKWNELKSATGLNFDRTTLARTLRTHGIFHWQALKRPKLTPKIAELRLTWAQKHENWTVEQWAKVIWSDEASVARGLGRGREWVFGVPEEKWD